MPKQTRNNVQKSTRRTMALYFGSVNLVGEVISHPAKAIRGIERRGERVLDRIERNNATIRRSLTSTRHNASRTASSVSSTARSTVTVASGGSTTSRPRISAARRSASAQKAARTRRLNARRDDANKAADRVQDGVTSIGHRIEKAVESVA